jgi:hypothetical protein
MNDCLSLKQRRVSIAFCIKIYLYDTLATRQRQRVNKTKRTTAGKELMMQKYYIMRYIINCVVGKCQFKEFRCHCFAKLCTHTIFLNFPMTLNTSWSILVFIIDECVSSECCFIEVIVRSVWDGEWRIKIILCNVFL